LRQPIGLPEMFPADDPGARTQKFKEGITCRTDYLTGFPGFDTVTFKTMSNGLPTS
jgi:hypothetical protein